MKRKYDTSRFGGVNIALNTPYDENMQVSSQRIKKVVRWYADKGVNGLYLCGSTGEGFLLNTQERKQVVEAVMDEVGDELTVIVHVGSASTMEACELARHAEECGCHGTAAVPSVYYRLSEDSIQRHWDCITQAADLPFFIYNIPATTGYNLSMNLFYKMLENERVAGIKNSSDSASQINVFKKAGGEGFIVFNGPDEQYLAGRMMGADGGIGGTYGCMPELYLKLESCIQNGEFKEAMRWQTIITGLIMKLLSYPSLYGAAKTIIRLRGCDIGEPRLPFLPVSEEDPSIQELYREIERYVQEAQR